jgi:hypothetical protein
MNRLATLLPAIDAVKDDEPFTAHELTRSQRSAGSRRRYQ